MEEEEAGGRGGISCSTNTVQRISREKKLFKVPAAKDIRCDWSSFQDNLRVQLLS